MKRNAAAAAGLMLLLSPALSQATTIPVDISISPVTEFEGNAGTTNFAFVVSLSNTLSEAITIFFQTLDSTATTADNDYQSLTSSIIIASGATSGNINISVVGDTTVEPDEIFGVRLTSFTYLGFETVNILVQRARGTIRNDDSLRVPTPAPLALLAAGLLVLGLLSRRRAPPRSAGY